MKNEVMIGMTENMQFFIGEIDEGKQVMTEALLLQHQLSQQGTNAVIHFGMVDPFSPYSESGNKPIPELPLDWFISVRKPRRDIELKYMEHTSGIQIVSAAAMPKGNGKKIVQAHRGETINFADLKPKK